MDNLFNTQILQHDNGIEYYTTIPPDYIVVPEFKELFTTNNNEKTITAVNQKIREGLELIIYNPQTHEYYPRKLYFLSDRQNYFRYYNDKNLYMKESDIIWKK